MLAPDELAVIMDRMWAQFLPQMQERVAVLEEAGAAARGGTLTPALRASAVAEAHKLAGVLGTFGLPQGTELAREAEALYARERTIDAACASRLAEIAAELRAVIVSRP